MGGIDGGKLGALASIKSCRTGYNTKSLILPKIVTFKPRFVKFHYVIIWANCLSRSSCRQMLQSFEERETWTETGTATVDPFIFVNSTNNSCKHINMV
jgi:hypothetical protein